MSSGNVFPFIMTSKLARGHEWFLRIFPGLENAKNYRQHISICLNFGTICRKHKGNHTIVSIEKAKLFFEEVQWNTCSEKGLL